MSSKAISNNKSFKLCLKIFGLLEKKNYYCIKLVNKVLKSTL